MLHLYPGYVVWVCVKRAHESLSTQLTFVAAGSLPTTIRERGVSSTEESPVNSGRSGSGGGPRESRAAWYMVCSS